MKILLFFRKINPSRLKLLLNVLAGFLAQSGSSLIALIMTPMLSDRLGKHVFGQYMVGFSLSAFAFVLCDLGMSMFLIKEVSSSRNSPERISELLACSTFIRLPVLFVSLPVIAFILFADGLSFFGYVVPVWLFLFGLSLQPSWLFQGLEAMGVVTLLTLFSRGVTVILAAVFVNNASDLYVACYINALPVLIAAVFSLYLARRMGFVMSGHGLTECKSLLYEARSFYLPRISVALYTQASIFIVSRFSGPSQAAVYAIADQFFKFGQMAISSISQALYPYMVFRKDFRFLAKVIVILVLVSIALTVSVWVWVDRLVICYVGHGYSEVVPLIHLLMVALLFSLPSSLLGFPMLGAMGFHRIANRTLLLGSILYAICIVVLPLWFVVTPVVLACVVCVSEGGVLFGRLVFVARKFKKIT